MENNSSCAQNSESTTKSMCSLQLNSLFVSRFYLWLAFFACVFSKNVCGDSVSSTSGSTSVAEQVRFSQLPPTVFAPSGRLHRVERVCQETTDSLDITSPLVVAMKCEGGKKLVLVCTSPLSPYLVQDYNGENSSNNTETPLLLQQQQKQSTLSIIGQKILIATAGNAMASAVLRRKIQQIVLSMIQREESIDDPAIIARYTADLLQIATQSVADEDHPAMLASSALILGANAEHHFNSNNRSSAHLNTKLWRVDPTGQFWDCEAAAIGRGAELAELWLLRHVFHSTNNSTGNDTRDDNTNIDELEERSTPDGDNEFLHDSTAVSKDNLKKYIEKLSATDALIFLKKCITETLSTSIPTTLQKPHRPMRTWGIMQGVVLSVSGAEEGRNTIHPTVARFGKSYPYSRLGRRITFTIVPEYKLQLLSGS